MNLITSTTRRTRTILPGALVLVLLAPGCMPSGAPAPSIALSKTRNPNMKTHKATFGAG
jgi:hypothetical protein